MKPENDKNDRAASRSNIVLLGFMGTGKTTVGKILARRLGKTFVDMDCIIEERVGKAISRIFAEDGESTFRTLERNLVKELSTRGGLVVATGGGVVLNPENVSDFERTGFVVCLTAKPEVILARISKETHRPLLEGKDRAARITKLLDSRRKLYDAIPHRIDTTGLTPDAVASEVIASNPDQHSSKFASE